VTATQIRATTSPLDLLAAEFSQESNTKDQTDKRPEQDEQDEQDLK
jgi:hypothetical protein